MSTSLVDFLLAEKVLTPEQVTAGKSTVKQLISSGAINEASLAKFLGEAFSMPVVRITNIDPQAVKQVPLEMIVKYQCLPVGIQDGTVHVAFADPTQSAEIETVKAMIKQPMLPVLTTFSNLEAAISKVSSILSQVTQGQKLAAGIQTGGGGIKAGLHSPVRPFGSPAPDQQSQPVREPLQAVHNHKEQKAASASAAYPVKKFTARDQVTAIFNEILSEAVAKGASDIHIEALPKFVRVRFRSEGSLFDVFQIPSELKDQLCSRIKIVANLDISERKIPQDGRLKIPVGKADYNFRVNIMPAIYGESIALRVLRPESVNLDLSKIGFSEDQLNVFRKGVESPSGMVLVTGPTGCGKTTTLYSALSEINHGTEKIMTVEDPVEYNLDGVIQVQVNNETGLGFATILKALLRQDPDVLLVGEIRDSETAAIAVQAALSGHLVLSTIHTNDAPSAILRLLNMGMEPFMVLTSVSTLVAQRLVRTVCPHCKHEVAISEAQLALLGDDRAVTSGVRFFRGSGCEACHGGGYKGRAAIFEVLELTESLKEMLLKGENPVSFKRKAMEQGMTSLRQSALQLAALGVTSLEEAIACTVEK